MSQILLVEDEPSILNLLSVNLCARGYQVVEARNGKQALEQLEDQNFGLMILDMKLPSLSGWDILDHLHRLHAGVFPVMVMTAGVIDVDRVLSEYPYVAEVFIKPFDMNQLILSVQDVLSKA
jgi:DNA-binding response OmpR family regulator